MERSSKKDLIVTLSVFLAVVFIVTGVIVTKRQPSNNSAFVSSQPASTTTTTTQATTTPDSMNSSMAQASNGMMNSSGFKDGTYKATSYYSTPESTENIQLSVTIKDGTVTDTSANVSAGNRNSREYASMFVQNYRPYVVGKNISGMRLSRISGSSLTTQGFNDAIATIQTQAKG